MNHSKIYKLERREKIPSNTSVNRRSLAKSISNLLTTIRIHRDNSILRALVTIIIVIVVINPQWQHTASRALLVSYQLVSRLNGLTRKLELRASNRGRVINFRARVSWKGLERSNSLEIWVVIDVSQRRVLSRLRLGIRVPVNVRRGRVAAEEVFQLRWWIRLETRENGGGII